MDFIKELLALREDGEGKMRLELKQPSEILWLSGRGESLCSNYPYFLMYSRRIQVLNSHNHFVAHCLIQIGYIRYSSGTWLNTANDIHFNICTTVSKEDNRKLKSWFVCFFVSIERFHMFIFLQFCTVFLLCHCDVGKQSPFIIWK